MKRFYVNGIRFILSVILVSLLLLSNSGWAKEYQLTILHTNDHHGHFLKFGQDVGGLAAQSTLVNVVRAEVIGTGESTGQVMVLSAGDFNTGVPESDLLKAEPDIQLMNLIGYDAMALGNHEFDNPRSVLMRQQEMARFPFVCANAVKKDTNQPLVNPYILKNYNGLRVAILGLITDKTPLLVLPANVSDLTFKNPIETAREWIPKIRTQADIIIVLSHLGIYLKGEPEIGDIELAKAVPEIDVIVGGHTHTKLTKPEIVGKTIIVQAGAYSEYVGRLDLVVDSSAKKVISHNFRLLSVNGKKSVKFGEKTFLVYAEQGYVEDPEALKLSEPYKTKAGELLSRPIGETVVELVGSRNEIRSQETNLANLITDSMRAKTGADIAFQNGGGIRASIPAGKITYRDVLTVQPFGNTLVTLTMTGEQILQVMDFAATIKPGNGAYLHVSGLKCTFNRKTGKAENVIVGKVPIDPNKTYQVVTNNFTAAGGDGYFMLKDLPQYNTNFVDADALQEYIGKMGKIEPKVEGRITIIE